MREQLEVAITRVLSTLEDTENRFWSREEISDGLQDGYDLFCRLTKCLFDMTYIENIPAVGSHSTDEEYEMALQIPRLVLANRRTYTSPFDEDIAQPGSIGPMAASTHLDLKLFATLGLTKVNPIGQLPRLMVEVEQVMHNRICLFPEFSYGMAHEIDHRYEVLGGTPSWFTIDKDGMFTLRRYPGGSGDAVYTDVDGWFGAEVTDDDYTGETIGSWGTLVFDPENFPMGGPWGAPTRLHPDENNTRVELTRLGRPLTTHGFEIPDAYIKYVEYWACARALGHEGPGQDIKLSQYYEGRFNDGVGRAKTRLAEVDDEYVGHIGHGRDPQLRQQVGLPPNYGSRIRRRGGY